MAEHPIPFTPAMVSAILARRKFTTRRILRDGQEPRVAAGDLLWVRETHYRIGHWEVDYSRRMTDERLRWKFVGFGGTYFDPPTSGVRQGPPADDDEKGERRWYRRPAMFMFRSDCRLQLQVTRVTTEALQEISPMAAQEEGIASHSKDSRTRKFGIPDRDGLPGTDNEGWPWVEWETTQVGAFRRLWEQIHGAGAWEVNPRVAVIEFKIATEPGGSPV